MVATMRMVVSFFLVYVSFLSSGWALEALWREEQRVLAAHRAGRPVTLNQGFTWRDLAMKAVNDALRRRHQEAQHFHMMPLVEPDGHVSHLPVRNGRVHIDFDVQRRAMRERQGSPSQRQEAIRVRLERERAAEQRFRVQVALRDAGGRDRGGRNAALLNEQREPERSAQEGLRLTRNYERGTLSSWSHQMVDDTFPNMVAGDYRDAVVLAGTHSCRKTTLMRAIQRVYAERRLTQQPVYGRGSYRVHLTHMLKDPHLALWSLGGDAEITLNKHKTMLTQYVNALKTVVSESEKADIEAFKRKMFNCPQFIRQPHTVSPSLQFLLDYIVKRGNEDLRQDVVDVMKTHINSCSDATASALEILRTLGVCYRIQTSSSDPDVETALVSVCLSFVKQHMLKEYMVNAVYAENQRLQARGHGADAGRGEIVEYQLQLTKLANHVLGWGCVFDHVLHPLPLPDYMTPRGLAEVLANVNPRFWIHALGALPAWRFWVEKSDEYKNLQRMYDEAATDEQQRELEAAFDSLYYLKAKNALIAAGYFTQNEYYDLIRL
ncbi:hypothetical protein EIL50_00015 [bacterium NHP-B]|nr:hypothetical protein EIL50_00015 [bacterium NHP-B]